MSVAIRAEGLSKQYRLGQREPYGALRDSIVRVASAPFRAIRSISRREPRPRADEWIWALDDVSFEIRQGDVVGIIGRNGSGKSTLLKILSRITEPTRGQAVVHGRVGSLLEVGTGFHPELTGRENVFVNGAILGLKRRDIDRKFDAIVAFAEVERFIDTPVKHYSSGMQMRLAFAVAAHLEPEILLVDEVLAVGDAAFQQKCLGKMQDVGKHGRTVVFVSHQMNQLRRLCTTCIALDQGRVTGSGPAQDVVAAYEASFRAQPEGRGRVAGNTRARFHSWHMIGGAPGREHVIDTFGAVSVAFRLEVTEHIPRARHGIALLSQTGQNLWGTAAVDLDLRPGTYELTHRLPSLLFQPGPYYWQVSVYTDNGLIDLWDCLPELVIATDPVTHYRDEYAGLLNMPSTFECVDLRRSRAAS